MMGLDLRELPVAQGGQDFDLQLVAVLFQRPGLQMDLGVLREPPLGKFLESGLFTGQDLTGVTTVMKEYSSAYTGKPGEIPYYAIINPENNALYAKYAALASEYPNLHLLGRLAEYKYYNMDAIAGRALELCDSLLTKS